MTIMASKFLSTPSARRATVPGGTWEPLGDISIHALREEGDDKIVIFDEATYISIHALREEGDLLL